MDKKSEAETSWESLLKKFLDVENKVQASEQRWVYWRQVDWQAVRKICNVAAGRADRRICDDEAASPAIRN